MSIFLNISNHPSKKWSDEQLEAATRLASSIVDLKPPAVPSDFSLEKVLFLSKTLLENIPDTATHAMVSTEYTLTTSIVKLLQARGIVCVAATTERNILELTPSKKTVVFKFIRFRKYPNLL